MKRKLAFVTIFLFAGLVACSENSDSGASQSTVEDQSDACRSIVQATKSVGIVKTSSLAVRAGSNWKLVQIQIFQSILSKKEGQQGYAAYSVEHFDSKATFKKDCGGMSTDGKVSFTYNIPQTIRANDLRILKSAKGDVSGDARAGLSHAVRITNGSNKTYGESKDGNKQTAELRMLSETSFETFEEIVSDEANSRSIARMKTIYELVQMEETELHNQSFEFASNARSDDGMGLKDDEAIRFANEVVAMGIEKGSTYLSSYSESFRYALLEVSSDGMGLSDNLEKAQNFAKAIALSSDPANILLRFKKHYDYARLSKSSNGLGLSSKEAIDFASSQTGLSF